MTLRQIRHSYFCALRCAKSDHQRGHLLNDIRFLTVLIRLKGM